MSDCNCGAHDLADRFGSDTPHSDWCRCLPKNKLDYNKMERKEAAKDGAKLVKNSGRGAEKGDAKLDNFLVDYKFNAKSFTLSLVNWMKHKKDAWKNGQRDPLVSVVFADGTKVAIIDWQIFEDFREKAWKYDELCK